VPALRVGLILDGASLAAWRYRALWEIVEASGTPVVAALLESAAPRPRSRVLRAYEALDARLFAPPRDPNEPTDASALLVECPFVEARAMPADDGLALAAPALAALRAARLDVLVQLGGGRLTGEVLDIARLGLWTFAHDEDARAGALPLFDAVLRGDPVTETRLLARTSRGEQLLYRSHASTERNSLARNRAATLWKSADFPGRALRGFAEGREPPFDGGGVAPAGGAEHAAHAGAGAVARFAASAIARVARTRARLRREERVWFIAVRRRPDASIVEGGALDGFEALSCPEDRFHADPILVHDGAAHHLFFEDADRTSGHGRIAWRPLDAEGRAGTPRVVLEADHHLSYPFVFRWRDEWLMIPETSERRTLEIHRAVEFPLRWEPLKVLFHDVTAVDATVVDHAGRLWLFLAMSRGGSLNDELHLFHAATPIGDWVPHPANPVVSDVRRARPAGPLFVEGGRLWRPGQDCAGDYGAALWLNRVDVLDERRYRETPVRRIDPSWTPGSMCTHTYARAGALEALDGRVWKPRAR
jgi:hypothetical protein